MERVRLSSIAKQIRGVSYNGDVSTDVYTNGYLPILRSNNIEEGSLNFEDLVFVPEEFVKEYQILQNGDILITASTGSIKVLGKNGSFESDLKCSFGAFCKVVRATEKVENNYLKHFFQTNYYRRTIQNITNGANINNIKNEHIDDLVIPLPSLAEQKAIAAKLDKAQEIIRYNEEIIAKYDALTQSLFINMFGDPVRNEKGWEIKTIEGLVSKKKNSLKRGPFGGALKKEIFVEKGYLVYEQFHALNNDFSMERYFINEAKFRELEGFSVKPKDIIISCSGVYLGKLAIIPDNAKEGIINQALLKLTLNESIMRNDFFVFHFTQNNFKNKYFDSNRGAGIPNFPPMSEFKKFPFISPPITLQNQFAERVAVIEAQKLLAQESLVKSQELFSSLLQESFEN